MPPRPNYLVLDTETATDGALVSRLRYPGQGLSPAEAVARFRAERQAETGSDFIPYTWQVPVAVAIAKVDAGFALMDLVSLDEPAFRPHVMTEQFWRGWEKHGRPTLVTFNGRAYDLPLLELSAFRYGIQAPGWFDATGPAYQQPRNRYNHASHLDLMEALTNSGASRFSGGLDLAASLL